MPSPYLTHPRGTAPSLPLDLSALSLAQLDARVRAANRWLDLPGAHLWPELKAKEEAALRACWDEMQRRRSVRSAAA